MEAMNEHISWATANAQHLVADVIDDELVKDLSSEVAEMGPEELIIKRRAFMSRVRERAVQLQEAASYRLSRLPSHVQSVLSACSKNGVNIPLLEELGYQYAPEDVKSIIYDIENGFPFVGVIPVDSRARPDKSIPAITTPEELSNRAKELSEKSLSKRANSGMSYTDQKKIYQQTIDEINVGRMTPFREPKTDEKYPVTRRFAVRQLSSGGKEKLRCIDDYLRSEINSLMHVEGRISMGRISNLLKSADVLVSHPNRQGEVLNIIKSDFRAAYRSCPIRSEHLPFTRIIVWNPDKQCYQETSHNCMPFGSLSAVYAWDRLGQFISKIIARGLSTPVNRYVDDLFLVDYQKSAKELLSSIIELVNFIGLTLDPDKSPEPSPSQTVLGVKVSLSQKKTRNIWHYTADLSLDEIKAENWKLKISEILQEGHISQHVCQKLAGRLNFISHAILGPIGGCKTRQLYHFASRHGKHALSTHLAQELEWWLSYLQSGRSVSCKVSPVQKNVPILYTDAEGHGGIGAYTILQSNRLWFRSSVSEINVPYLRERKTQIIAYEALAVRAGIERFCNDYSNRRVVVFIDNLSVKGALSKGRCKSEDIHHVIEQIIDYASSKNIRLYLYWVPSSLNIADIPSRGAIILHGREVSIKMHA